MQDDSRCSKTNHNGQTDLYSLGQRKKYGLDSVILLDYKDANCWDQNACGSICQLHKFSFWEYLEIKEGCDILT